MQQHRCRVQRRVSRCEHQAGDTPCWMGTPLGVPVVPDVKLIYAIDVGFAVVGGSTLTGSMRRDQPEPLAEPRATSAHYAFLRY